MYISYWNPLREMQEFQRTLDEMFRSPARQRRGYPPIDLIDVGDQLILRAILPGIASEDVQVSVSGEQVSIRGTKKVKPAPEGKPIRRERMYGEFHRVIRLPEPVDTNRVHAERVNGILTLYLPKARTAGPVTIPV